MGKVLYLRKGETHTKPKKRINKGQLITMDLGSGSKQYRVLKIVGTVVEVLAKLINNFSASLFCHSALISGQSPLA